MNTTDKLPLGNFSVSLAVKNLERSLSFYQKLGFAVVSGDQNKGWVVLLNGNARIGLFQGMFEKNILTFNPGWDAEKKMPADFVDVRDIQKKLRGEGIEPAKSADESTNGPEHFMLVDPDGNEILVDQHV
jgi:catechol 2,3-dioxygenase-like lactoylglutathione lyase family enzyme